MSTTPARRIHDRRMSTADAARAQPTSAELAASVLAARQATEAVTRLLHDVDTDQISLDGVVVDPIDDDDTLVQDARTHLAAGCPAGR